MKRSIFLAGLVAGWAVRAAVSAAAEPESKPADTGLNTLRVHLSWGHQSKAKTPFLIRWVTNEVVVADPAGRHFEPEDAAGNGHCRTLAGGGDVDAVKFELRFPERAIQPISNLQEIWAYLFQHADAETRRRLESDPAYRPDTRKLTIEMNEEGTRGFSVTVDQLLINKVFWIPELDVFMTIGDTPPAWNDYMKAQADAQGRRILQQTEQAPEASYEQFAKLWEDMGSPAYQNPKSIPPGHIIGITWDSALHKFGIDLGAGARNDYGAVDKFQFHYDIGEIKPGLASVWKGQRLSKGLPVITTTFEKDGVGYEIEQFAYPLHGPMDERRGDIPMVLLQKVKLSELKGQARTVNLGMTHQRAITTPNEANLQVQTKPGAWMWEDTAGRRLLLAIEGAGMSLRTNQVAGSKSITNRIEMAVELEAHGSRELVVKLPSPVVPPVDQKKFMTLDYHECRYRTILYWENYLGRGAYFDVPEPEVNDLFRANLWHALRLPRRHGGEEAGVKIDLPYSNFAYDQNGTPWPVNEAIYVDYMIYDLRGYHDIAAEELEVIYRNNQEPNGHVGGFANWGVYTPSMIYAVAKNYLLSHNRDRFESLLPQTLRALDWCQAQLKQSAQLEGAARGLVLAPLNDLSHDKRAWSFNQAYFFAALDLLGRALAKIDHPRAAECQAAAKSFYDSLHRAFGQASVASPLVPLRDGTWIPYVPGDALTPRRLFQIWYPTDVDTGPLHLSRLKAIDPKGPLTTFLLNDHEDNLFLNGWGMANEPVYNQQATAYLLRDEVKAAIRAFYSMMACAFSHSTFEPVEHRWGWGQYFGPPSTDGAWFDLYRHMLIHELDDGTLLLFQATPRKWLEDDQRIKIERAPTYFGPVSASLNSQVQAGEIESRVTLRGAALPKTLLVRFRHPESKPIKSVTVNNQEWRDFDPAREWVRIPAPKAGRYIIKANYN